MSSNTSTAYKKSGIFLPSSTNSYYLLHAPNLTIFVSVTKFIRIGIADKNDNPPYFDKALYEAEVDENEDIQHTVLTVTAKDHDECKYTFFSKHSEIIYDITFMK